MIYHEAFHWAAYDPEHLLVTGNDHPIAEDFANYFATALNGTPTKRDLYAFADWRSRVTYDRAGEFKPGRKAVYNSTTYLPSLLWKIRRELLPEDIADRVAWNSIGRIDVSTRYSDYPRAYLETLAAEPSISFQDAQKVHVLWKKAESSLSRLDAHFERYFKKAGARAQ